MLTTHTLTLTHSSLLTPHSSLILKAVNMDGKLNVREGN